MKSVVPVLTAAALTAAAARDFRPCIPVTKNYGLVCVCNETYCDTVPPLPTSIGRSAVVYTSSRAG